MYSGANKHISRTCHFIILGFLSAVPPALSKPQTNCQGHCRFACFLLHSLCLTRTTYQPTFYSYYTCGSTGLLRSVPFVSSSKQRSQSVAPYSCRHLKTRVSFFAFALYVALFFDVNYLNITVFQMQAENSVFFANQPANTFFRFFLTICQIVLYYLKYDSSLL